jgi:hypothetical protein
MPDWTYEPLRGVAARVLGPRPSQRAALRLLAVLAGLPGGRRLIALMGGRHPWPGPPPVVAGLPCRTPIGVSVGPGTAADAVAALPPLGASLVEIGPVAPVHARSLARALGRRRHPGALVALRVEPGDLPALGAVLDHVDLLVTPAGGRGGIFPADRVEAVRGDGCPGVVLRHAEPAVVASARQRTPGATIVAVGDATRPSALAELVDSGADVVLTTVDALVASGPGLLQRTADAAAGSRGQQARVRDVPRGPHRWPGWVWGSLLGLGMLATALGAAAVTVRPVLLWYDRAFLGTDVAGLDRLDARLVPFLQHDRITLAGTMAAIAILYVGLSAFGMRRGWVWSRDALLASGAVGFATPLYLLVVHYLEPVHIAVTVLMLPLFLAAVWRAPRTPRWTTLPEGPEPERRRALLGQLVLVSGALGVVGAGFVISIVGLTSVFVPSDLTFMGTSAGALTAGNPRLLEFVAHDRAGFGGALLAAGVAQLLLTAWGWRRGDAWVWWTLLLAAAAALGPALAVHIAVGYVDVVHLLPVWVGIALSGTGLALSHSYLCTRRQPGPAA